MFVNFTKFFIEKAKKGRICKPIIMKSPTSSLHTEMIFFCSNVVGMKYVFMDGSHKISFKCGYRFHSDEGLTLETSVFESFTVANLPYRPCG